MIDVCDVSALVPDRGSAALVDGNQIALFYLSWTGTVHAVSHRDPFTGANVIGRGLVGSRGDEPIVMSPLHKQAFSLITGQALDYPGVSLQVWEVQVVDGRIQVGAEVTA